MRTAFRVGHDALIKLGIINWFPSSKWDAYVATPTAVFLPCRGMTEDFVMQYRDNPRKFPK